MTDCKNIFIEDHRFANTWELKRHIYTHSVPGSDGGEFECAMRCLTDYSNRCHFYAYVRGYCFYGDFNLLTGPTYGIISSADQTNLPIYLHPFIDQYFGTIHNFFILEFTKQICILYRLEIKNILQN